MIGRFVVRAEFGLDRGDPPVLETDSELIEAVKEAIRLSPTARALVERVDQ